MHDWFALVASLVGLAVGPVVQRLAHGRSRALDVLDGFVLVAIAGLALVHVLPHAIAAAGGWALVAAAAGLWAPTVLERRLQAPDGARGAGRVTLWLVLIGLMAHAALDGAALAVDPGGHGHGHAHGRSEALALAVVVHQLPMGLVVYLAAQGRGGTRAGVAAVAAMMAATVAGFFGSDAALAAASPAAVGLFEAVVIGGVLHVVGHGHVAAQADDAEATLGRGIHLHAHEGHGEAPGHGHEHAHDHGHGHAHAGHGHGHFAADARAAHASAVGALLGGLTMFAVGAPAETVGAGELAIGATALALALEVAPLVLLAYVGTGLLAALPLPRLDGGRFAAIGRGLLYGA
ncbi:MAG: hypothetical protein H6705_17920, partial [Myxococcales bacterium]|nr:hypothetical protein [Myxococcales bacterium]